MEKARSVVLYSDGSPEATAAAPGRSGPRFERSLRTLRGVFLALDRASPRLAAWAVDRMFFTPPRPPIDAAVRARLALAEALSLSVDGRRLFALRWGAGPRVALMHGWGGHLGQLLALVDPLVAAGHEVVAFDAPGHGLSGPSRLGYRQSSFVDFAGGLGALSRQPEPLHGLLAHSGGAVAAGLALAEGVRVERLVLIAPMAHPGRLAGRFAQALGLADRTQALWRERARRRIGLDWDQLDLPALAGRQRLPPTLVIHDRLDREVAWSEGQDIASRWPGAALHTTAGLGHRRILSDAEVIRQVVAFVA